MTNEQIYEILRKNGFTRIVERGEKIILDKGHGEAAEIHYLESCINLLSMEEERLATEQFQISNNHFWGHQMRHTEDAWRIVYKADDELTREEKLDKLKRMDAVERREEEIKELRTAYGHLHGRVLIGKIILPVDLLGDNQPQPTKAIRKRRTVVELEIITPKIENSKNLNSQLELPEYPGTLTELANDALEGYKRKEFRNLKVTCDSYGGRYLFNGKPINRTSLYTIASDIRRGERKAKNKQK